MPNNLLKAVAAVLMSLFLVACGGTDIMPEAPPQVVQSAAKCNPCDELGHGELVDGSNEWECFCPKGDGTAFFGGPMPDEGTVQCADMHGYWRGFVVGFPGCH